MSMFDWNIKNIWLLTGKTENFRRNTGEQIQEIEKYIYIYIYNNFQTWTNAIYTVWTVWVYPSYPKEWSPTGAFDKPFIFATEVLHAMLECTSVAQRCSLTMWKSGTAHPSWSHLENHKLNGGSLLRSCFVLLALLNWNTKTWNASKTHRYACVGGSKTKFKL